MESENSTPAQEIETRRVCRRWWRRAGRERETFAFSLLVRVVG